LNQYKAGFGGLDVSDDKATEKLEAENAKLGKRLVELLDTVILQDSNSRRRWRPSLEGMISDVHFRCDVDVRKAAPAATASSLVAGEDFSTALHGASTGDASSVARESPIARKDPDAQSRDAMQIYGVACGFRPNCRPYRRAEPRHGHAAL
jgi:hypothetical protein